MNFEVAVTIVASKKENQSFVWGGILFLA